MWRKPARILASKMNNPPAIVVLCIIYMPSRRHALHLVISAWLVGYLSVLIDRGMCTRGSRSRYYIDSLAPHAHAPTVDPRRQELAIVHACCFISWLMVMGLMPSVGDLARCGGPGWVTRASPLRRGGMMDARMAKWQLALAENFLSSCLDKKTAS